MNKTLRRKVKYDGSLLRDARKRSNLSQEDLSQKIGVTSRTIIRAEQGDVSFSNLTKICTELGITPDALIEDEDVTDLLGFHNHILHRITSGVDLYGKILRAYCLEVSSEIEPNRDNVDAVYNIFEVCENVGNDPFENVDKPVKYYHDSTLSISLQAKLNDAINDLAELPAPIFVYANAFTFSGVKPAFNPQKEALEIDYDLTADEYCYERLGGFWVVLSNLKRKTIKRMGPNFTDVFDPISLRGGE